MSDNTISDNTTLDNNIAAFNFTVYDTSFAGPAENVHWRLQRIEGAAKIQAAQGATNAAGNPVATSAKPHLTELPAAIYELQLFVADYFQECGWQLPQPPLLDYINLRFYMDNSRHNYHLHIHIAPHSHYFALQKHDSDD